QFVWDGEARVHAGQRLESGLGPILSGSRGICSPEQADQLAVRSIWGQGRDIRSASSTLELSKAGRVGRRAVGGSFRKQPCGYSKLPLANAVSPSGDR